MVKRMKGMLDIPLAACVPTSSFIILVIREIREIRGQALPVSGIIWR
jgi:hypothetical protein